MRTSSSLAGLLAVIAGCASAPSSTATPAPEEGHPLAIHVGQPLIIAPVQAVRVAPELGWSGLPPARSLTASLDSVVADTLRGRVGGGGWIFSDGLEQAARNNPTYATDPRGLAVLPLRSSVLKPGDRLPEPLSSQLRTMIALQEARLVLLPVELRFDRTDTGLARPTVRLVLVDPRTSTVSWIGEISGADLPAFTPSFTAQLATRFADLFAGR